MYGVRLLYGFHLFKAKARQLVDQGITVIPVIIGNEVNKEHVKPVTDDEDRIVPVKPTDKPKDVTDSVDEKIKEAIKGKLHHAELQNITLSTPPPKKDKKIDTNTKDNYFGYICPLCSDLTGGSAFCDGHKTTMRANH